MRISTLKSLANPSASFLSLSMFSTPYTSNTQTFKLASGVCGEQPIHSTPMKSLRRRLPNPKKPPFAGRFGLSSKSPTVLVSSGSQTPPTELVIMNPFYISTRATVYPIIPTDNSVVRTFPICPDPFFVKLLHHYNLLCIFVKVKFSGGQRN